MFYIKTIVENDQTLEPYRSLKQLQEDCITVEKLFIRLNENYSSSFQILFKLCLHIKYCGGENLI